MLQVSSGGVGAEGGGGEDLSSGEPKPGEAALPACCLSLKDSGMCCIARLQRFGCKLYLAYLFFVGV